MGILHRAAAIGIAGLIATSTLGFAPAPSVTTYQDVALFPEEGSQAAARVQNVKYEVAIMPTVELAHLYDAKPKYRWSISVLDRKGHIRYFREMSEARAINTFGRYTEVKHHAFKNLRALSERLDRIANAAHVTY